MANGTSPVQQRPPCRESQSKIVKDPVEARQAFRGRPVLIVLLASLFLLIVAFIVIGTVVRVP